MIGYRRAAVVLHGMHEDDRQWILSELDSAHRTAVKKFIDELDSLGFSSEEPIDRRALFALQPKPGDRRVARNEPHHHEDQQRDKQRGWHDQRQPQRYITQQDASCPIRGRRTSGCPWA